MTEPAQPKPIQDVVSQNLAAYEAVFNKSIEAAKRIKEKSFGGVGSTSGAQIVLEIGTSIFKQFFTDQGHIQQAHLNAQAMVRGISGVMDGRS